MKVVNVKGIGIIVGIFLIIHVVVGVVVTPFISNIIIDGINKNTEAKISVERLSVWPLTASVSIKNLKIFDPDSKDKVIVSLPKTSIHISVVGLLRKQLAISNISSRDAVINLEGEPDGSFNVDKIVGKKEAATTGSMFDRFKEKPDLFSKLYGLVKNRVSKKEEPSKDVQAKEQKPEKIVTEVIKLPRGRRVKFSPLRGGYLLSVGELSLKNVFIHFTSSDGEKIDIKNGTLNLNGMGIDPEKGVKFDKVAIKGFLEKEAISAGRINISYLYKNGSAFINANIDDVNLPMVSFVYDESLPVVVKQGLLSLNSNTVITNDELDSDNSIILKGGNLEAKKSEQFSIGSASMPIICQALNEIDPVKLKFSITGTMDNPKFEGLGESVEKLVKPYIEENIKKQGESLIKGLFNQENKEASENATQNSEEATENTTEQAVNAIKGLFGK